jgi:signal transduction histidine kinase
MMGHGRDLTALHADGTELPVEIGLSRVRWQRKTMTLAAVSDISVRKRLELELRQANANLQEFTYVASHDLRSPLRGIADLVEWIVADLGDAPPPAVRHNLGRISQRIERMEHLIGDLLSYARAGSAQTAFSTVAVDAMSCATSSRSSPCRPASCSTLEVGGRSVPRHSHAAGDGAAQPAGQRRQASRSRHRPGAGSRPPR